MKTRLSASGFDLTAELEKYAMRKIAQLSRQVPRGHRSRAECQIYFEQVRRKGKKINTCTVGLMLDGEVLKTEEATLHMYTSLDIAMVHIERQLIDYAAQQRKHPVRERLRRFWRSDWM